MAARAWSPHEFLVAHVGSRDSARVIYGAVIGLALVVALEDHPPGAGPAAAATIGTALAVGLAEAYSESIAAEVSLRRRLHVRDVREIARGAAAVVAGAGFPALYFALAGLGWVELDTAFDLAKWTGLVLLCTYGFVAARLAGAPRGTALLHALAVGVIGALLIVLKALLH